MKLKTIRPSLIVRVIAFVATSPKRWERLVWQQLSANDNASHFLRPWNDAQIKRDLGIRPQPIVAARWERCADHGE